MSNKQLLVCPICGNKTENLNDELHACVECFKKINFDGHDTEEYYDNYYNFMQG